MNQKTNPRLVNPYLKQFKEKKRNERRRQLRRLFPTKYLNLARYYVNKEVPWIKKLFYSMKRSSDKRRQKKINYSNYDFKITWEEFWQLWENHKKKYGGFICGYTGVKMTHERSVMKDPLRNQSHNISVDRLDPNLPYTADNIVFCTVKFNNIKGAMTRNDCLLILKKFIEYGK